MRNSRKSSFLLILSVGASLLLGATSAAARMQVGQKHEVLIDTARDYPGSPDGEPCLVWEETIGEPGATYIAVYFREFDLAPGDTLRISDAAGGQVYTLTNRGKMNAGTFWARHIKGDTAVLQLFATSPDGGAGFFIDQIATGTEEIGSGLPLACNENDMRHAICYETSYPEEYEHAKPVARLLLDGVYWCTAWLLSPAGHLMTNAHCITDPDDPLNLDAEFMAEAPTCDSENCYGCWPGEIYDGSTLVRINRELDYAVVQLFDRTAATVYGYLELDTRPPVLGERIYIPQHPGCGGKQLAIESSSDADGLCHVNSIDEAPCPGTKDIREIGYYCDTDDGSSGSPVISAVTHKVVALNHCGFCLNRGIPIGFIHEEIADILGLNCEEDADCDDGLWCNGPESCFEGSCAFGGSPCDPSAEVCLEEIDQCIPTVCDNDGTCEAGENCVVCPEDCVSGELPVCGNGVCEVGAGEDCKDCPEDCGEGLLTGRIWDRICCGRAQDCADPQCWEEGRTCSDAPGGSYCCGDDVCSGLEDDLNCALDCGTSAP